MAYLPTVNEFSNSQDKPRKESADKIVKSVSGRMDLSSVKTDVLLNTVKLQEKFQSNQLKKEDSTVGTSDKTSDILNKLYNFIVKDYSERDLIKDSEEVEQQVYDNNSQERELSLLRAIPELLKQQKEDEKEGILGKLWRYFKYFSFGKMAFNNWDKISKLLGLEKLTESIKGLSNEFGLTSILQNIKDVIDDIMTGFSEKVSPYLPQFMGGEPSQEEIRLSKESVNPKEVYDYLRTKGVDHEHAMGMLTNIMGESGFRPGVIGDDGTSGGLFQHHNERFAKMKSFVGPDWQKDWKKQVDFALTEKETKDYLSTSYVSGKEATVGFTKKFEKPKDADAAARERLKYTESLENRVVDSTTTNSTPSTTQEQNTSSNTPAQKTTEQKPAFSVSPKKDVFETKSAVETVFETTTTKPKSIENNETISVNKEEKKEPTAQRVSKKSEVPLKMESTTPQVSGNNPLDIANKFLLKDEKTDSGELNSFIGQNFGKFDVTKTPWCAAFANSVLNAAGYKGTGNAAASSFLNLPGVVYDKLTSQGNVQDAKPGDVAVFSRTDGHHVGFVQSVDSSGITIVGGNQSDKDSGGQVSSSRRGFDDLLGIRRPGTYGAPTLLSETPSTVGQKTRPAGEQKTKSFLETAIDAYRGQVDLLNNIFSPDMIKQFEENIINIVNEIPKKERFTPDIGSVLQQNNFIVNNIQQQKISAQDIISTIDYDLPPIFQQYISQER